MNAAEILALLAKHEPTADALTRVDLTPAQVRAAAAKFRPVEMPTPEEARRAAARSARRLKKGHWGRHGMPEHVVRAMYAEYQTGKSCGQVAAIFGGRRQSVFDVFKSHQLPMRPRHAQLLPKLTYGGRDYTMHKGYYRATTGDRTPLHHQMWTDAHGPIPAGWQVSFLDANVQNLTLENLLCRPIAEVTKYHLQRHRAARSEAA